MYWQRTGQRGSSKVQFHYRNTLRLGGGVRIGILIIYWTNRKSWERALWVADPSASALAWVAGGFVCWARKWAVKPRREWAETSRNLSARCACVLADSKTKQNANYTGRYFYFRPWQSGFDMIVSDGVMADSEENENLLTLLTPISPRLSWQSGLTDFWFFLTWFSLVKLVLFEFKH